jgi:hypothetical protein
LEAEDSDDFNECLVATLGIYSLDYPQLNAIILDPIIHGRKIRLGLDTGTAVSVMSEKNFREHFPNKIDSLKKTQLRLQTYIDEVLKPKGVASVRWIGLL